MTETTNDAEPIGQQDDGNVSYELIGQQIADRVAVMRGGDEPDYDGISELFDWMASEFEGFRPEFLGIAERQLRAKWEVLRHGELRSMYKDSVADQEAEGGASIADDGNQRFHATASINFDVPAADKVDGPKLFAEVVGALTKNDLVYFQKPEQAAAVALWIMASRFMDSWSHFPHLTVTAPTPESGKSALVTMVNALTPVAKQFGRVTPASIRNIYAEVAPETEDGRPQHLTVTVDEMDAVSEGEAAALVMDMKLAFDRVHASTSKNIADDTSPSGYRVITIPIWGPKLMSGIGLNWIDAPLKSRAIIIHMRPKPAEMIIPEIPHDIAARFAGIRSRLVRFGQDAALSVPYADLPDWLKPKGRLRNAWGPLFRVAAVLGGDHPRLAKQAFGVLTEKHALDDSIMGISEKALRDAHAVMNKPARSGGKRSAKTSGSVGMTPTELVRAMNKMDDRPWSEISYGRALTTKKLADLLGAFDVRTHRTKNQNGGVSRLYRRDAIEKAAKPLVERWSQDHE